MGVSQSTQTRNRRTSVFTQNQFLIRVDNDFPYFVLCFRRPLTVTLILHNKDVLENLENTIRQRWPNGIKKIVQTNQDGSAEIQLTEDSFRTLADLLDSWKPELIFNFKRFLCVVLSDFHSHGWRVGLSTDTWTRYPALSTLIFEKSQVQNLDDEKSQIFAISLSFEGNMLLVNCNERLKEAFQDLVKNRYPPGIQEIVSYGNDIRYRLAGSPWTAWPGDQSIRLARRLLLASFNLFYNEGCKYYCAMNTADFGDCIFFEDPESNSSRISDTKSKWNFMCLTFYNENKIHLIAESDSMDRLETIITDAVKTYWHLGLKAVVKCPDDQSYEITLKGTPFVSVQQSDSPRSTPDDSAAWQARFFICHLFQNLLARGGWRVEASFDAHRKNYDSATYIFKQRPNGQTAILQHSCLALDRLNCVRVVNDANDDLAPIVRRTIVSTWSKGINKEMRIDDIKGHEFVLAGQPWFTCLDGLYANSLDGIAAQTLVCILFSELKKNNWTVAASASTCCLTLGRGRHKQRTTADTWILVKNATNIS